MSIKLVNGGTRLATDDEVYDIISLQKKILLEHNIKDIKDYKSNADYWLNLCMQFPVDFCMHIYTKNKRYQLYYIKNKKGEFDWVEINSDKYSNLNDNASTSVINVANSLYIMFSDDYIVKPCYRDKNNNFEDL